MCDDRKSDPPDFELRKYELDRAHELELNKFAHALDVERLKILQLINGGAFTVLVGFSSALLQADDDSRRWTLAAALCWVGGLGAAAWAAQKLREVQACQNQSNRFRRNATEWRQLTEQLTPEKLRLRIGPPQEYGYPSTDKDYDDWALDAYVKAKALGETVKQFAAASILLFILGAALLSVSVGQAEPEARPPADKGITVTLH